MFVNDIDDRIDDFESYAKLFEQITHRTLSHEEWTQIKTYLASRQQIKPPVVQWSDFRSFADRFDVAHPYFMGHPVPMLIMATWAQYVNSITPEELDVVKRMWRTAR
ncbi:MAG: hypothetical protein V4686_00955 [Patescibacteria group bacterium]